MNDRYETLAKVDGAIKPFARSKVKKSRKSGKVWVTERTRKEKREEAGKFTFPPPPSQQLKLFELPMKHTEPTLICDCLATLAELLVKAALRKLERSQLELTQLMPWLAALAYVGFMISITLSGSKVRQISWLYPAAIAFCFFVWTCWTVASEGPLGFWNEHTHSKWCNQIWFDLLSAASIGWWLIFPRAKKAEMKIGLWLLAILLSGCIGFWAMVARLIFLEENKNS